MTVLAMVQSQVAAMVEDKVERLGAVSDEKTIFRVGWMVYW